MLGIIHVNKSSGTDTLTSIMGSRALTAVARSVLFAIKDPSDESLRMLGNEKNNLGRSDLKTYHYRLIGALAGGSDIDPIWAAKVDFIGELDESISDIVAAASDSGEGQEATTEAADWLGDFLSLHPNGKASQICKAEGDKAGHSVSAVNRARKRLGVVVVAEGMPRKTIWSLPPVVSSL